MRLIADGVIDGVLNIEMSQDETDWVPVASFQAPGHKTLEFVAPFMRVRHANNQLGSTPTVSIGAINDDTAQRPINVIAPAANLSIDSALSEFATLALDQSVTIDDIINCEAGDVIELAISQEAAFTVTWGGLFLWEGGTPPTITTGAGARDLIELHVIAVDAAGVATEVWGEFAQAFA